MTLLTEALILGLFAMSLDLMVGYARLISFGHAAAYGFGAYACGNFLLHTSMPLPCAVLLAGSVGRDRRDRRRLGLHPGHRRIVLHADPCVCATALRGRVQMDAGHRRVRRPGRHPAQPGTVRGHLVEQQGGILLSDAGLSCWAHSVFCRELVRSPFGAVLRGIRENEAKTVALGYNTRRYKIAIVAISYGLAGLAGALYAPFAGFANTELLFWLLSGQVLIMVIVGGAGTLIGPILGAMFFLYVQQKLSTYTDSWALFFGVIFILFVLFIPEGIWGLSANPLQRERSA